MFVAVKIKKTSFVVVKIKTLEVTSRSDIMFD